MKQAFRHYGPVVALLALILALALLLTALTGGIGRQEDRRPQVLVTTYPLYVAAQNVIGDTDAVRLTVLSGSASGCLHDYQLSPADRLAVEQAEVILINGAGAETFLDGLVPTDKTVDTSHGVRDLICTEYDHDHGEADHDHGEPTYNEHVWVSPDRYRTQVQAVMGALMELDPAHADTYLANGTAYDERIAAIAAALPHFTDRPCVLFHDSLSYLAQDMGLDVKLTLTADGESGLSAADLKKVEKLARDNPDLLLFYDSQYPQHYDGVGGTAVVLETAVVGDGEPTDWLDAMGRNVEKLTKLTEGGDAP